jgi:lipoprotein-anchoring transpeptidase ErfK/SrfK
MNVVKTVHMFYENLFVNPEKNIEDLAPEHFVYASVKDNTPLYNSIGGKISSHIKGGKVEIIRDRDYKWYYIKSGTLSGWTKREYLSIDTKFDSSEDRLNNSETEYFVNNYFNLTSQTNYLIWVDLKKQLINIFTIDEDLWKLERQIPCATGKNISPTIKGTFSISSNRGTWMPAGGNIWVKNYVGFYSSYFFHSVKVKRDGTLYDGTVGTVASAGCIRMPLDASEWFSKNIPVNTTVFIR